MAPRIRTGLVVISVLVAIAGCGGLGEHGNHASQVDATAGDLPTLALEQETGTPDGAGGIEFGPTDADDAERSRTADTTAPSADGGVALETPAVPPVSIIVLPDTQYYNADYGHAPVFAMQTNWIIAQKSPLNIQAVLHVGDIVDDCNSIDQWTNANSAMRLLDGVVPYFLVPGNHDVDGNRKGLMNDYFGPPSLPWVTSTMTQGQIENNYALVDIGPRQWLVLGLEFGPRDAVMTWADAVLKAYPDRPAIILTHAYLYSDGNRYDIAISGLDSSKPNYQYFIPHSYGYTSSQGINDGEQIWQKLILTNPNVRLVFSGHVTALTGGARLTSTRPDGSRVHQMLSDYQWYKREWFGYGYMRVLQFDYSKKTIQVETYSPYTDDYLTDDANQFTLDLSL
ncbi:MAG TPA: metallophosphoesterase [Polyangia bacterium]